MVRGLGGRRAWPLQGAAGRRRSPPRARLRRQPDLLHRPQDILRGPLARAHGGRRSRRHGRLRPHRAGIVGGPRDEAGRRLPRPLGQGVLVHRGRRRPYPRRRVRAGGEGLLRGGEHARDRPHLGVRQGVRAKRGAGRRQGRRRRQVRLHRPARGRPRLHAEDRAALRRHGRAGHGRRCAGLGDDGVRPRGHERVGRRGDLLPVRRAGRPQGRRLRAALHGPRARRIPRGPLRRGAVRQAHRHRHEGQGLPDGRLDGLPRRVDGGGRRRVVQGPDPVEALHPQIGPGRR